MMTARTGMLTGIPIVKCVEVGGHPAWVICGVKGGGVVVRPCEATEGTCVCTVCWSRGRGGAQGICDDMSHTWEIAHTRSGVFPLHPFSHIPSSSSCQPTHRPTHIWWWAMYKRYSHTPFLIFPLFYFLFSKRSSTPRVLPCQGEMQQWGKLWIAVQSMNLPITHHFQ